MAIVEATAAFAPQTDLGKKLEAAMSGAALQSYSEGITDPVKIKERMIAARDQAIAANA